MLCGVTNVISCFQLTFEFNAFMNTILFRKEINLQNKQHFVGNEMEVMDHGLKMHLISLLPQYRVIRNDCRGFNNLSYTIRLR